VFERDLADVGAHYRQGRMWVAEEGGTLLGCGGVVAGGGARVIKRIYVAKEARRRGLARELLRRGCAWGDFARTELWSDVRFRDAHRMYLSEGFRRGHTQVLADPDRSVERFFWR
jgi:putative acetyltransferase